MAAASVAAYYGKIVEVPCIQVPPTGDENDEADIDVTAPEEEQKAKAAKSAKNTRKRKQGKLGGESIFSLMIRCASGQKQACQKIKDIKLKGK